MLLIASVVLSLTVDAKGGDGGGGSRDGGEIALPDGGPDLGDFGDLGGLGDPDEVGDDGLGGSTGDLAGTGETDGGTSGADADSATGGSEPPPVPDPDAEAFAAVKPGDCLRLWHDGTNWSSTTPTKADCDGDDGIMFVNSVQSSAGSCPNHGDKSYIQHTDAAGKTTAICFSRNLKAGYCLLAQQEGSGDGARMADINLMSQVDCTSGATPAPWNQILHITGVYQAPAGTPTANNCARGQTDQTYYWWWVVNEGETLLCTMVYGG